MSIAEIMEMCIEPSLCKVEIYSAEKGDIVWSGWADSIPDNYVELPFESFDVPKDGAITVNID